MSQESARLHAASESYFNLPKYMMGSESAQMLRTIHNRLARSGDPQHLFTGGSAAVEASIVGTQFSQAERLSLLDQGDASWRKAQELVSERGTNRGNGEFYRDYPHPYRLAMNRASIPIVEGIIEGDVTKERRERYYNELLTVAAYTATDLLQAEDERDDGAVSDYVGIAFETIGALSTNRLLSPTLIALPTLARADNGENYPEQTHDILLMHLDWGEIRDVTTLEVKARLKVASLQRYEAMLLGGRVDLLMPGSSSPVDTIEALIREHDGTINQEDKASLERVTDKVVHLLRHHRLNDDERRCSNIKRCDKVPASRNSPRTGLKMGSLATGSGVALTTP